MKLLNYTTSYFSVLLLIAISVWAGLFYYAMLDEIYDSIDDGLDNQKRLIIKKFVTDSSMASKTHFEEGGYIIKPFSGTEVQMVRDEYKDTLMYMENEMDLEPSRLLKTAFGHDNKYFQLMVFTSMVEEDDLSKELLYSLLWLYGGLLLTILLLNNFVLRNVWKPFNRIVSQLKNFRLEEKRPITVVPTRIDEFKTLNNSIQEVIKSNINTYNNQKEFIENASHEMQTPLAISLAKLEALAGESALSEGSANLLLGAINSLERLMRLNKSLLLLTKIQNGEYSSTETISINSLSKKLLDDYDELLKFHKIYVSLEESVQCEVSMNEDLAYILLSNLVRNAIIHNHHEGTIVIAFYPKRLVIRNSSKSPELDRNKIFTRFYKYELSEHSNGLGLSIVKAIVDAYGFRLSYSYENNTHGFIINF